MERIKNYKYYAMIKNIIRFEIFYKCLVLFIMSPVLRRLLQEYLNSTSYGIAFNQDMIYQFLSLKGIVVALFLFLILILTIFYELYVVIHLIAIGENNKEISLRLILLKSFGNLKSLHYPSMLICGIYMVLLLPLVHIGYLNSYIPRWDIPPFIFGELKLTMQGQMLIVLAYLLYYTIYILLIFAPMFMILKRQSIITAIKESVLLLKRIDIKEKLRLLTIIVVWIIIEYLILHLLPYPILHNRDFNLYFIKYVILSSSFRYSVLQYVFLYIVSLIAMIAFLTYMVRLFHKYNDDYVTVDQISINTDRMNKWIYKVQVFLVEKWKQLKTYLLQIPIYQKHKRLSQGIIVVLILCLMSLYLHKDALLHRPWVIGHRGSGYYVENSYEAVKDANDSGADFAEIDIQLSKDGIPIVFHDTSLSRLSNTNKNVADLTAKQLQSITLTQNQHSSHIITLEELIQRMQKEKMTVGLLVEFKPTSTNAREMVDKVIQIIDQYHFSRQAIFMSLNMESVQILNEKKPQWWVGYCIYGSLGDIDDSIWDMNIDFLAMEENRASTAFIQKAVKHMIPIYIWTVDNVKKMKQYLDMGVCGIITNYPDAGKEIISEYQTKHFQYYYYDGKGYPKQSWT